MNISASYLPSLFSGFAGLGNSLVSTLYGFGSQATKTSGIGTAAALKSAETNQTRDVKILAARPDVKRATDAFAKGVASAASVEQLLRNPAVMEVLLTANGLGDQIASAALARQALTSNLSDPKSLVNRLTDTRWKSATQVFDFAQSGMAVIRKPEVLAKLTDAYAEVKWRQSLNKATPGLSKALTFRAQAAKVTSVDQILGDPVLRDVVTTALAIPKQIAFQSLTAQERAISTRLDITKLKDPKFVETFVQRYLLAANTATTTNTTSDLTTLASQAAGLVI